jgi:hypothetical protein
MFRVSVFSFWSLLKIQIWAEDIFACVRCRIGGAPVSRFRDSRTQTMGAVWASPDVASPKLRADRWTTRAPLSVNTFSSLAKHGDSNTFNYHYVPSLPVTVAERSKACTVFARSEANRHGCLVCVCVYSVCVAPCLGRGLATSWSPV